MKKKVNFKLDGKDVSVEVEPNELLLNVLREKIGLPSPKYVCGIGECGACTVLVDGKPVLSCLTLAIEVDGKSVTTSFGIDEDELKMIEKAFADEGAVQCGYCTPGFTVMTASLLREKDIVDEDEIKNYLRGNLCRCTGYVNIIKAIKSIVEKKREGKRIEEPKK